MIVDPCAPLNQDTDGQRTRVLLIGFDREVVAELGTALPIDAYTVEKAPAGRHAQTAYDRLRPHVVLIDVDPPGAWLRSLVQHIRGSSSVPIIALSSSNNEADAVATLECGADDYITKPVRVNELLARIRVAVRHAGVPNAECQGVVRVGELEIYPGPERRVLRAGRLVHLSRTEYNLLLFLAGHADKFLTHRMLIEGVWSANHPVRKIDLHVLHVYMARLRNKLERDPSRPQFLITEPRAGYRLVTTGDGKSGALQTMRGMRHRRANLEKLSSCRR